MDLPNHLPCDIHPDRAARKRGMILYVVITLLGLLTALAWVVFTATRVDFQVSRNYVLTQRAFEQAESGMQFTKRAIEQKLVAGQSLEDIASNFHVDPPEGYDFEAVTSLDQLSDTNLYLFPVTGRAMEARATLEATIRQSEAMALGIFGDVSVDTMPNVHAYSYNAETLPGIPVPPDSTGEASVGSNEELKIQPNVVIDGRFVIGQDVYGVTGIYPSGWDVEEMARIEPDPLGIESGNLAAKFTDIMADNDNNQSSYISGNKLVLKKDGEIVLTSGNYYLTEVEIDGKSSIVADTSAGPVNIFLSGGFYMAPGGDLTTTGKPSDFRIFSNSTEQIQIKPKGHAEVFVYAPNAEVQLYPNDDFYGAVWAERVDLKPGGDIWIDVSLLKKLKTNRITIVTWKEVRR